MTVPVDESLFGDDLTALRGGACEECGTRTFPARPCCPGCQSAAVQPVPLAGTGRIWTYTVLHAAPPEYTGTVPYALGVVELDDGVRITATLLADDPTRLRIGDPVRFELTEVGPPEERRVTFAFRVVPADERSTR